jgi:hypothetical protein
MRGAAVALLAGPLVLGACHSGASISPGPPAVPIDGLRTDGDRSLVIAFVGASPDPSDPCWVDYRPDVVTGPARVTVTIRGGAPRASGFDCPLAGYVRVVVVELGGPLGDRRVVDGATGRERRPFDGSTLLRPKELPAGWGLLGEGPGFDDPERSTSWVRTWGTSPTCPGAIRVDFLQGPEGVAEPVSAGSPVDRIEVRGAQGVAVSLPEGGVRLAWTEPGGWRQLTGIQPCSGSPPVDVAMLVEFARALG